MTQQSSTETRVRPELDSGSGDDTFIHFFCECGAQETPMRARCGKTKETWNDVDWECDPSEVCMVCDDLGKGACDGCGK